LLLIAVGLALVNHHEMARLGQGGISGTSGVGEADTLRYAQGALLAVGAVACWTWYPLRNARWLRENSHCSGRTWATAQGLVTLPLALLGGAMFWLWNAASSAAFDFPLGPTPLRFVGLMLAAGLLASWLGTLCWNEASQRLPTALVGQLIVFETLAALSYVLLLRGQAPSVNISLGMALLLAGVLWALRSASSKPNQAAAQ
jgi:drug/metabolite transporter (DMT)-like permease